MRAGQTTNPRRLQQPAKPPLTLRVFSFYIIICIFYYIIYLFNIRLLWGACFMSFQSVKMPSMKLWWPFSLSIKTQSYLELFKPIYKLFKQRVIVSLILVNSR